MARTGSFGRLPKSAPNLASTIVAMLQEFQNMQDSNMENAWKNGGLYEGKPVTDEMLLKHFTERRDQVSKEDPTYDYFNNKVLNYGYTIRESKTSLLYAQKKISAAAMAAFYRKEASELPTDSEAYRQLMRNAAQFADAQRSAGRARSSGSKANAYAAARDKQMLQGGEQAYGFITDTLLGAARDRGILLSPGALGTGGEDFADINLGVENDPARIMELIDDFDAQIQASKGKKGGLYDVMRGLDPSFTHLDATYLGGLVQRVVTSANARVALANKYGYKGEAKTAATAAKRAAAGGAFLAGMDEVAAYAVGRQTFDAMMSAANTASERKEARDWWAGQLDKLARGVGQGSPYLGPIQNEINAVTGKGAGGVGLSLMENASGTGSAEAKPDGDLGMMVSIFASDDASLKALAEGSTVYVQGNWDVQGGKRVFTPSAGGRQWGTTLDATSSGVPINTLINADMGVTAILNPDGSITPAYAPTRDIVVTARSGAVEAGSNPTTGESTAVGFKVDPQVATQTIGKTITTPDGTVLYGVYEKGSNGRLRWTSSNPWNAQNVAGNPIADKDGNLLVTMRITDPKSKVYDPFDAADPTLTDPNLTHTDSWYSVYVASKMATDDGKKELLSTKPEKAEAVILAESRGDPVLAAELRNDYYNASSDVFLGPANARDRDALRRNMPRYLPDEVDERVARAMNQPVGASMTNAYGLRVTSFTGVDAKREGPTYPNDDALSDDLARARARFAILSYDPLAFTKDTALAQKVNAMPVVKLPDFAAGFTGQQQWWGTQAGSLNTPPLPAAPNAVRLPSGPGSSILPSLTTPPSRAPLGGVAPAPPVPKIAPPVIGPPAPPPLPPPPPVRPVKVNVPAPHRTSPIAL